MLSESVLETRSDYCKWCRRHADAQRVRFDGSKACRKHEESVMATAKLAEIKVCREACGRLAKAKESPF